MDANNFIALAGKLAVMSHADEAAYRTAVSRAYYGAFHVARLFLTELGFEPVANANVHAFVRHYLSGSRHRDARLAAAELADLQQARNRADYQLDNPDVGSRAYAMVSVERATRIISALDRCQAREARDSIRQGIAEYERRIRQRP
jgi:uncharacterized protein (UPF0332 family)